MGEKVTHGRQSISDIFLIYRPSILIRPLIRGGREKQVLFLFHFFANNSPPARPRATRESVTTTRRTFSAKYRRAAISAAKTVRGTMTKYLLITQRLERSAFETRFSLSEDWCRFLRQFADVVPVLYTPSIPISKYFQEYNFDGVVLTGGNDISFNMEEGAVTNDPLFLNRKRDEYELEIIDAALRHNIPIFGCCRGTQLICAKFDATLKRVVGHTATIHAVEPVNPGRHFSEWLAKNPSRKTNSYHNWGISSLPPSCPLEVCLVGSEDRCVEAVEYKASGRTHILGVMWHPERKGPSQEADALLFERFFGLRKKLDTDVLILAAGQGTRLRPLTDDRPKCLVEYKGRPILDYILGTVGTIDASTVTIISGYMGEKISIQGVHKVTNHEYQTTNMVYSMFCAETAFAAEKDLIISYSDIVYTPEVLQTLIDHEADVAVVVDFDWYSQWSVRMEDPLMDAETCKMNSLGHITELGNKPRDYSEIEAQYIGLVKFSSRIKGKVRDLYLRLGDRARKMCMTDFLCLVRDEICPLSSVPISGGWCEIDSIEDMRYDLFQPKTNATTGVTIPECPVRVSPFHFGTKADNLRLVQDYLTTARVSKLLTISVADFLDNEARVLQQVVQHFGNTILIVRSSSSSEDSMDASMAGKFLSLDSIDSGDSVALKTAFERVIASYGQICVGDQVLVQESLSMQTSRSGVVFTLEPETHSAYTIMTYDNSGKTDLVTSGQYCSTTTTLTLVTGLKCSQVQEFEHKILNLTGELEKLFKVPGLDVEFGFDTEDELYLFQVRPLVAPTFNMDLQQKIGSSEIQLYHNLLRQRITDCAMMPGLYGAAIYGTMSDWNPAEIIGVVPNPLALSLYKELVTDVTAMKSRTACGYRNVEDHPLLCSFFGRPYVDIRVSFNSFVPATLSHEVAKKLVEHYIHELEKDPSNHDKIEFNICFTCCGPITLQRLISKLSYKFSSQDIGLIHTSLVELTNTILGSNFETIEKEMQQLDILEQTREYLATGNYSAGDKIKGMCDALKTYGVLPFANLARYAFIGRYILLELQESGLLSALQVENVMNSVSTVSTEMLSDVARLETKELTELQFLAKYGHLRPGTYDITCKRYDEGFHQYFAPGSVGTTLLDNKCNFTLPDQKCKFKIDAALMASGLTCNSEYLLHFVRKAICAREKSKFIFSRTLSDILQKIKAVGSEVGLCAEEMSYVPLRAITENLCEVVPMTINFSSLLRSVVDESKAKHRIAQVLQLPTLITKPDDVICFSFLHITAFFHHGTCCSG